MSVSNNIATLIPHTGDMCLLDEVVSWDDECIVCAASSHRSPDNPLRSDLGLLSLCGIEYAAQAVAVHNSLNVSADERVAAQVGYLANVKEVTWFVDRLDEIESDLMIQAKKLISEGGRSIYTFVLSARGNTLMRGRVAVVLERDCA